MAKQKKKKKLTLFILVSIIILIISIVLFLIPREKSQAPTFLYEVEINPSRDVIIKNILPVSDMLGKSFDGTGTKPGVQGYAEITIINTDKVKHDYSIVVSKQENNSQLSGNYIKFFLTDADDNPVGKFNKELSPVYESLEVHSLHPAYRIVETINLAPKEQKKFKLRTWLADSYVVSLDEEQFKYVIDVFEEY